MTITRRNYTEVSGVFDLIRERRIPRACFYHLVYAGRGSEMIKEALDAEITRETVGLIMGPDQGIVRSRREVEVLTVDNHCDGPFVYLRLLKENPDRAAEVWKLLSFNEGNNTGRGIGCVSWDGAVHPDQFWRHDTVGNVRERPFSEIWTDPNVELLANLRNRKELLHGRCATCRFLGVCNGNFRVRAEAMTGDLWAPDPACYLTDAEIAADQG